MTSSSPPTARRRGAVARALRRVLLALLREEVEEMRRGLEAHQGALDGVTNSLVSQQSELAVLGQGAVSLGSQLTHLERVQEELSAALESLRGDLGRRFEMVQRAHLELQTHLETMIVQIVAEVAELRSAFFTVRSEFEGVRDGRLPVLEGGLEELSAQRVAQLELDGARLAANLQGVQAAIEDVRGQALGSLTTDIKHLVAAVREVQAEMERVRDERVPAAMRDLARLQAAYEALQREVEGVRDERVPRLQEALEVLQGGVGELQRLGEELRDQRLPALAGRCDALIERLHEQLETTSGVLDRVLAKEPLRLDAPPAVERELPMALRQAHLAFAEEFRGTREEILGRVGEYVHRLMGQAPVLDLGCGRGELLEALQRAGVEARGVDADPAMVEACRRRGLEVVQGDALEVLSAQPPGSLGAVTALHLFEHLPAGIWANILQAAAAALQDGGVVLVECPNPEALRVGANLFWSDPTHWAPVHRQALAFTLGALGFEIVENTLLHPFPPEQMLATPGMSGELQLMAARLDGLLSAPRDWLLVGRKPQRSGQ